MFEQAQKAGSYFDASSRKSHLGFRGAKGEKGVGVEVKLKERSTALRPQCVQSASLMRPGGCREHMEQELTNWPQLQISATPAQHSHLMRTPKREGGSPTSPPRPAEDAHSDRYQTFLRVRANRHTRLNVDDLCWCRCYVKSAPLRPHSAGAHLDCTQAVRIGKLKRRKPEEGQEGSADLAPLEDEWNERRRIQMTSIVGGFKGAMLVSTTSKECRDSDADLDVDGDDTLEYGRAQYTETDVIPCSGENSKETTVNSSSALSDSRVNLEYSKWLNDGSPSTSSGEKVDGSTVALPKTCKNTEIET
ncbi:E3 ubiquitin-protein ligase RNF220-like isoform X3, partial [Lates japonicus]